MSKSPDLQSLDKLADPNLTPLPTYQGSNTSQGALAAMNAMVQAVPKPCCSTQPQGAKSGPQIDEKIPEPYRKTIWVKLDG